MAVMKACEAAGVKRCVITSAIVTVKPLADANTPQFEEGCCDGLCFGDPKDVGLCNYVTVKTLAEKSAFDFVKSLPKDKQFELVTICPPVILGPTLIPEGGASGWCANYIKGFMDGSL